MSIQRQASGAVKAGNKIGGQFATHERDSAAAPSIAGSGGGAQRHLELFAGKQRRAFDYGNRAYDMQTQRNEFQTSAIGHLVQAKVPGAAEFVLTPSQEGDGTMALFSIRDASGRDLDVDPEVLDELRQEVDASHFDMEYFGTDTDEHTGDEICPVSVNYEHAARPEDDLDLPAPERAISRIERVMGDWVDGGDDPDTKLKDALTDLMHYADKHGLDFDEITQGATWMKEDEVQNPDG
ncbi:hypothetical protein [Leucobacter sp. cx-169]|uniref:hypothetical protein n=1 Tax=Leucobacter sp. cx-169 TaxID=2770549 RepID=UPI00165D64FF|nr:hypothetical protein [Leucobacter sp. cx-169]MBC9927363.1 hypothetical protein [Leucobacter sp. cx-169]